jgi:hypothetical protein
MTVRADEALRPSEPLQVRLARLLVGEELAELEERAGVVDAGSRRGRRRIVGHAPNLPLVAGGVKRIPSERIMSSLPAAPWATFSLTTVAYAFDNDGLYTGTTSPARRLRELYDTWSSPAK